MKDDLQTSKACNFSIYFITTLTFQLLPFTEKKNKSMELEQNQV